MATIIEYKDDKGSIIRLYPTPQAMELIGVDAIAGKDVPAGKSYTVVEDGIQVGSGEAWVIGEGTDWEVIGYINQFEVLVRHLASGQVKVFSTLTNTVEE